MEAIIIVSYKDKKYDVMSLDLDKSVKDLHIKKSVKFMTSYLYKINGDISKNEIKRVAKDFLTDPVTQVYEIKDKDFSKKIKNESICDVWFKYGVTDVVGETIQRGIKDLGIKKELDVKTGKRYIIKGEISKKDLIIVSEKLLANIVIENYRLDHRP